MEIKTVDVESLAFDENNARHHGERNLEAIRGSLATFGQVEPLVVQAKTGRVIGGNGRLAVLKKNGAATVEVVEVDLDDQQASALGLALNRTAELAEWDVPNLELLTHGLEDFDLAGIGFAPDELQTLLDAPAGDGSTKEIKLEDLPTGHQCPRCGFEFDRLVSSSD